MQKGKYKSVQKEIQHKSVSLKWVGSYLYISVVLVQVAGLQGQLFQRVAAPVVEVAPSEVAA